MARHRSKSSLLAFRVSLRAESVICTVKRLLQFIADESLASVLRRFWWSHWCCTAPGPVQRKGHMLFCSTPRLLRWSRLAQHWQTLREIPWIHYAFDFELVSVVVMHSEIFYGCLFSPLTGPQLKKLWFRIICLCQIFFGRRNSSNEMSSCSPFFFLDVWLGLDFCKDHKNSQLISNNIGSASNSSND